MMAGLAAMSAFNAICAATYVAPEDCVSVAACRLILAFNFTFWSLPPLHVREVLRQVPLNTVVHFTGKIGVPEHVLGILRGFSFDFRLFVRIFRGS